MEEFKYAIQHNNGQLIDYCNTIEQAQWFINKGFELVEIAYASKVLVEYTELGGPLGYGHQEPSFETYGPIKRCISNLCKWMQSTASTFGPDARDIRDFFRHCSLYVNGENKTQWLLNQIDKLNMKEIYV